MPFRKREIRKPASRRAGFSEVFTRRGVVVLGAFEVVGAAPTND